ncbi:DcuS/MalK family sensor histidine kinase [Alkalicoccobacillus gibsonii]|uniref:DcuS/MalK family sensor histidine kinase n=1 Tax=Alkalicoccobacillus gibsonii TaxID=79881 RepID=UPI001933A4EF|nr:DcuS/MalK family sensor histidine kinase [Alkalicoccobacillus gibsonii]MBM0065734.1 two-component system sensor histidine kinase DcuS [Alkalicoccobacillus gibsonii]
MTYKKSTKRSYRLQTVIVLFVCTVLVLSLSLAGILVAIDNAKSTRSALEDKVWTIATSFARSPVVIEGLENEESQARLLEYTEEVQSETNVEYIVVIDMERVRLTHPTPEMIGERFVGNDVERAFEGETYSSTAEGTLGESLRTFIPVYNEQTGEQIGVVAVGMLTDHINAAVYRSQAMVWIGGLVGLVAGLIGAILLARKIKRSMQNLEPVEIAQLLESREAMLSSVQEGIIAVDAYGKIILLNEAAVRILQKAGKTDHVLHKEMAAVLPEFELEDVLKNGKIQRNKQLSLQELELVVNRVPLTLNDQGIGAMVTFQDKTELTHAMDQLSGVKSYAEALRLQTHEFMNKLHVVSAMVHTESYEDLQAYIQTISTYYQEDVGWISRHVNDPVLVGYLLNKLKMVKNQGIKVQLIGKFSWPSIKDPNQLNALITVIGNSLDNAVEALQDIDDPVIELTIDLDGEQMLWQAKDNGKQTTQSQLDQLVDKGISTKGAERGYGLYLMNTYIKDSCGKLTFTANVDGGVTLRAIVPIRGVEHD